MPSDPNGWPDRITVNGVEFIPAFDVAAALAQARKEGMEEAARIAEETGAGWFDQRTFTAQTIAAAIRAKAQEPTT
jgi:hypothetical protein